MEDGDYQHSKIIKLENGIIQEKRINMKKCTSCKILKNESEFGADKKGRNGLQSICKICSNKKHYEYQKTIKGLIVTIYQQQKTNSRIRKMNQPTFSRNELEEWIIHNPYFNKLYKTWVESGYIKQLRPSIDRLDDYKGYSLDNIRLVTFRDNEIKNNEDRINGKNNKKSKAVIRLSKDGIFEKEYYSAMNAEREDGYMNQHIITVCKGKAKTTGGKKWMYKQDYIATK